MNSLKARLITAAATLAIAAGTASAQHHATLTASIPFAFSAGAEHSLPAGNYRITEVSQSFWALSNVYSRNTRIVGGGSATQSHWNDRPQLVFECRGNSCSLRKIQAGGGDSGYMLPAPKRSKSDADELARVVVVRATLSSAD